MSDVGTERPLGHGKLVGRDGWDPVELSRYVFARLYP